MSQHDPLCPPGLKSRGPDECFYCLLLTEARKQERQRIIGDDHKTAAENRP